MVVMLKPSSRAQLKEEVGEWRSPDRVLRIRLIIGAEPWVDQKYKRVVDSTTTTHGHLFVVPHCGTRSVWPCYFVHLDL
jgi:hypothetical protein